MQQEAFRSWLSNSRGYGSGTISSRISNCKTVEDREGDLDRHFKQDHLQALLQRLTYSKNDERQNRPPGHQIPIDGNIYNGTATLRSAVSLYKQFCEHGNEETEFLPTTRLRPRGPAISGVRDAVKGDSILTPGTILQNRYRIIRHLAAGGMGAIYEAIDQRLNSVVALKETLTGTAEMSRAFEGEASLLANLQHPALPVVIDHFLDAGGQFLVMQFIAGDDLGARLEKRGKPFPVSEVLDWADQLLDALDYLHLHEPPIVHRDIKPLNIKLGRRGEQFCSTLD